MSILNEKHIPNHLPADEINRELELSLSHDVCVNDAHDDYENRANPMGPLKMPSWQDWFSNRVQSEVA